MKVLHITTEDSGGAGLCAYRISKSLQEAGVDSRLITYRKTIHPEDKSVKSPYVLYNFIYRIFHKLLRILGIYIYNFDKLIKMSEDYGVCFSTPVSSLDISDNKWVQEADIIHLHWVDFFFNQPKFLAKVNKPIVWTLHDENFFYGAAHYHDSVLPDDPLERKYRTVKLKMVKEAKNLNIVLLSKYFERTFGNDEILKGKRVHVINNSVDCSRFTMHDKTEARQKLGLESKKTYFVFVAAKIADRHKGLNELIEAIESFHDDNMSIIAIGDNKEFTKHPLVLDTGRIGNADMMSLYLSAADYFIMPSKQEAFAQTPIEAMACGKPAIVTPVSGTEELITPANGVICNGFEPADLAEGIKKAMSTTYDPDEIRKDVMERFSPQKVAQQYVDLYKEIVK